MILSCKQARSSSENSGGPFEGEGFSSVPKKPKGQLISKCLLVSSFGPKYQRKILTNFLESKKWRNQQNKGTFL